MNRDTNWIPVVDFNEDIYRITMMDYGFEEGIVKIIEHKTRGEV